MREEAETDGLYMTKEEIQTVINGLNLLLEQHYRQYEDDVPEFLIDGISKFIQIRNNFKYCVNCRNYWYKSWSHSECRCPAEEE